MSIPHPAMFNLLEREMEIFDEREIEAVNNSPALDMMRRVTLEGSPWSVHREPHRMQFRFCWKSGADSFLTIILPHVDNLSTDLGPVS